MQIIYWALAVAVGIGLGLWLRNFLKPVKREEAVHKLSSGAKWGWDVPVFSAKGPLFLEPWIQPGAVGNYVRGESDDASDSRESLEILWHVLASQPGVFHLEATPLGDEENDVSAATPGNQPERGSDLALASTELEGDIEKLTQVNRYVPGRIVIFPEARRIEVHGLPTQVQYVATLKDLLPGRSYLYNVYLDNVPIFTSGFTTRKAEGETFRAIVFGDFGNGSPAQKKIAYTMSQPSSLPLVGVDEPGPASAERLLPYPKPQGADLVVSTGDVVYQHGRWAEYLSKYFTVYQNRHPDRSNGGHLLDHALMISCVGNHDMAKYDPETLISFDEYPDLMAWYGIWSLPMNGPVPAVAPDAYAENRTPVAGPGQAMDAALAAAGNRFPGMANYSYDFGNAHFLVLDANPCMDWANPDLRNWVENDLSQVKPGIWKIVIVHQPPFTSNVKHQREQRIRLLADIFERQGVKIVFCGHAHVYERSYPLKFKVAGGVRPEAVLKGGYVEGEYVLDKKYDGQANTSPDGVIYIVTGGGGAKLDSRFMKPESLKPFTSVQVNHLHSFTVCDFGRDAITVRQLDDQAHVVDQFVITRN